MFLYCILMLVVFTMHSLGGWAVVVNHRNQYYAVTSFNKRVCETPWLEIIAD